MMSLRFRSRRAALRLGRPRCSARSRRPALLGLVVLGALGALAAGCVDEEATPIDEITTTAPDTPHLLAPTEEMRELAEQQCLDDPELEEGEVNAVDPSDPEEILASVVVDCDEVRDGDS